MIVTTDECTAACLNSIGVSFLSSDSATMNSVAIAEQILPEMEFLRIRYRRDRCKEGVQGTSGSLNCPLR